VTVRQRACQTVFVGGPDDNNTSRDRGEARAKRCAKTGGGRHARLRKRAKRLGTHLCEGRNMFVRGYCWGFVDENGRAPCPEGHPRGGGRGKSTANPADVGEEGKGTRARNQQHATLCGVRWWCCFSWCLSHCRPSGGKAAAAVGEAPKHGRAGGC